MKKFVSSILASLIIFSGAAFASSDGGPFVNPLAVAATPLAYADATGTGDALLANYPYINALTDGLTIGLGASAANTLTNPTFSPTFAGVLQTSHTIVKGTGQPLVAGDIAGATAQLIVTYNLASTSWYLLNPSSVGTVQSVSVSTANGVSGSVATATTTPAITLTLGAITPTSINGVTTDSTTNKPVTAASLAGGTLPISGTTIGVNTSTPVAVLPTGSSAITPAALQVRSNSGTTDSSLFLRRNDDATGLDLWNSGNSGQSFIDQRFDAAGTLLNFRMRTSNVSMVITAVTINGAGLLTANYGLTSTAGTTTLGATVIGTHLVASSTSPSIASGFGTSPTITVSANTMAFQINVGSGGTATGGVITMPAATTGYACTANYNGSSAGLSTYAVATNTTTVTLTNETSATGIAAAWPASQVLNVQCTGF